MDFDQYGYCRDEKNDQPGRLLSTALRSTPWDLRIVLNDYYRRYHLPLLITENGLGMADDPDRGWEASTTPYRIDYHSLPSSGHAPMPWRMGWS